LVHIWAWLWAYPILVCSWSRPFIYQNTVIKLRSIFFRLLDFDIYEGAREHVGLMIKIVTVIDLQYIDICHCWHFFLVFNIWVSQASEMTRHFYYTQPLSCIDFHLPNLLLTENFVHPTLFSSVPPPPPPPPPRHK
jgi:hypothetical protein